MVPHGRKAFPSSLAMHSGTVEQEKGRAGRQVRAGMVNCCFVPSWSCEEQQEAQSLLIEELDTRRDPERIPGPKLVVRNPQNNL